MLPMILLGALMVLTWGAAIWATFIEKDDYEDNASAEGKQIKPAA